MSQKAEQVELMPVKTTGAVMRAEQGYELILRAVSDPQCDPAKLRELLAVRREWNADEADAAFNAAVVRFQQECPIIPKLDKAYDKMYARIDRIWRTVRPLLERCGLAVTWESVKPTGDMCILDGHLRHTRGHAQPLHHEVPLPDLIKGQNSTQRGGSAETYAKRYALCAALGIQTGDDDDDGNAGGRGPYISEAQAANLRELCEASGSKLETVMAMAGVTSLEQYPESAYNQTAPLLKKRADKGGGA